MFSDFDRAFKNGQRFDNIKLTKNHPCPKCKYGKELNRIEKLKPFIKWTNELQEEQEKLLHNCNPCEKMLNYIKNCCDKLKEYESIDISTEHLRMIKENNIKNN